MTDGPARRVLALDTGPAIYLDALGYVPTVSRVSDIVIPGAVAEELRARLDRPGATVPELPYVSVRHPAPQQVDAVAEQATLDPGESEVLVRPILGCTGSLPAAPTGRSTVSGPVRALETPAAE